ncbi:MAG: hypothetical protein AVDCRST_MAG91-619 [uncultured Sphingomonadaceae bacterium]|uniref:Metallo-beta-lactamase domain-containing protein n=1 Tax=uncultured Sphingomonadaceae bacterium TaxID=169976 RepID=A0A6J4S927_9SPHN|nr:MAG: hypothetical protein AVDCRST_MAG91-619 [uncultured Sphingomonadaceae bacterium]
MRIEKHVHSCILLTLAGERLLFDPGAYSFVDGRVDPATFSDVSTIVLTHTHPDHIDKDALRTIADASGATLVGNTEVAAELGGDGFEVSVFDEGERAFGAFNLRALPVDHEPVLAEEVPQVTAFIVNDRLLNPGDSFDARMHAFAGIEVLLLPVIAPFLIEVVAYDFAKTMRPRHVVPVHDGHVRDFFLPPRYDTYDMYMKKAGITFQRLMKPGDGFDLA